MFSQVYIFKIKFKTEEIIDGNRLKEDSLCSTVEISHVTAGDERKHNPLSPTT